MVRCCCEWATGCSRRCKSVERFLVDRSSFITIASATFFFDDLLELCVESEISLGHGLVEIAVGTLALGEIEVVEGA